MILVSSEHAFPFHLTDPRLRFNLQNLNQIIYAGEIAPNDMYKLLTEEWKLSSKLATILINIYGGHIYDIYQALQDLESMGKQFSPLDSFLSSNVQKCLKWNEDKDLIIDVLKQLANSGFYPLEEADDPIARIISENNVGGVVRKNSLIVGLNEEVWEKTDFEYGIVPSKQSMRLVIAKVLHLKNLI